MTQPAPPRRATAEAPPQRPPTGPTTAQRRFLEALDRWILEHGHAAVPRTAMVEVDGAGYPLGVRVMQARADRRRGDLSSTLTGELEQRAGWHWSDWDRQLQRVRDHLAAGGRLEDLPQPVSRWLARQRQLDATNHLLPDRRALLEQLPGALERRDSAVPRFVRAARAWLSQQSERSMADLRFADVVQLDDGTTVRLGERATYFRRRHAGLAGARPLTGDEAGAIAALPGWRWELDERRRHPRAR